MLTFCFFLSSRGAFSPEGSVFRRSTWIYKYTRAIGRHHGQS